MGSERLVIDAPILLWSLFAGCALIIFFGRVEIAAGVYCATQRWAYSVDVGPTVWVWVWVFTLVASAIVFYLRQPSPTHRNWLFDRGVPGIIAWGAFLILWLLLRGYMSQTAYATGLMKNILIYDLLSFIAISLFGSNLARVKAFAFVFVGTTLISGMMSLTSLTDLSYQVQTLRFQLRGFDAVNYLAFAVPFSIATVWLLVFMDRTALWWLRILVIAAMTFCVFCLLLTGARQSIVAVVVAWAVFILWTLQRNRSSGRTMMVALVLSLLVGVVYYGQTLSASRWIGPEANLVTVGGRTQVWQDAWNVFLGSPVWGSGFDYFGTGYGAHDLWLDVLAGHGIVGFIFLNGFLVAVLRCARGTWAGIGSDDLTVWRMGAFCVLVYALVQAIPAGTIGASASHLFWTSALIWQLSIAAQYENTTETIEFSPHAPVWYS